MKKIDPDKLNKILNHIKLKWKSQSCPMCRESAWNVNSMVYELREFKGGGLVIGGDSTIIPVTPITCTNCGYIVLLNTMFIDDNVIKKEVSK